MVDERQWAAIVMEAIRYERSEQGNLDAVQAVTDELNDSIRQRLPADHPGKAPFMETLARAMFNLPKLSDEFGPDELNRAQQNLLVGTMLLCEMSNTDLLDHDAHRDAYVDLAAKVYDHSYNYLHGRNLAEAHDRVRGGLRDPQAAEFLRLAADELRNKKGIGRDEFGFSDYLANQRATVDVGAKNPHSASLFSEFKAQLKLRFGQAPQGAVAKDRHPAQGWTRKDWLLAGPLAPIIAGGETLAAAADVAVPRIHHVLARVRTLAESRVHGKSRHDRSQSRETPVRTNEIRM